jgi:hypothetical protein
VMFFFKPPKLFPPRTGLDQSVWIWVERYISFQIYICTKLLL